MTNVTTWEQTEFARPNCELHRDRGDYYSLDQFIPTRDQTQLKRLPTWDTRIAFGTDFSNIRAMHYDRVDERFVMVGSLAGASTTIATQWISHADFTTGSPYGFSGTPSTLGDRHRQNVLWALDEWTCVGSDGHIYQGSSYSGALSDVKSGYQGSLLAVRDTIFFIDTVDDIYVWDDGGGSFNTYFSPDMRLHVTFALHYRDYIMLFGRTDDGSMTIYRVDDHEPIALRQLAVLPSESGRYKPQSGSNDWSKPFVIHEDDVYFSPGLYVTYGSSPEFDRVPIYVFDGASVELVDIVTPGMVPDVWGLLTWKGRLLLYFFEADEQHIYLYTGGRFTEILSTTVDMLTYSDLYSLAGELIFQSEAADGSGDGVQFLRAATNNVFTSAWLDMGHPTSVKYLSRISALVSNPATDLEVKVEYRTELNGTVGSWTTAVANTDNTRHLVGSDLEARFHLLQIRVTFTDNSSTDPDTRLESIAATYSYGVR